MDTTGNAKPTTEVKLFEDKLAWMKAVLTPAVTKSDLSDSNYIELRKFLLEFPILRSTQYVLDSGVRNLGDERRDATEFALAINMT